MKQLCLPLWIVLLLAVTAPIVTAQVPYLQVYFDSDFTVAIEDCPGEPAGTVVDELYVVAHNFGAWISAVEFRLPLPPEMLWLGDVFNEGSTGIQLWIGNTQEGIGVTWTLPENAFVPVLVCKVRFLWMCDECLPCHWVPLCFEVYPGSGRVRAVRWPDNQILEATSGSAYLCPNMCGPPPPCPELPIPVEETTWGAVKALYAR